MDFNDSIEFDKKIIYQNPIQIPEPLDYDSPISWVVQTQIAHNNGKHYTDRIGKLKTYPVYELPLPKIEGDKLMLDIGSGWGRWLIAGANKGYIPIGIDIKLKLCETQQQVLQHFKLKGYSIVADLENLPFCNNLFDLVWSFSVIQHTHYKRLVNCLQDINDILKPQGFTYLEFPNKNGFRNKKGVYKNQEQFWDDYNHWCVRYYTPEEYEEIINQYLTNFEFDLHSFLGIGVLKEDLKYVSLKNKIPCLISLLLSSCSRIFPKLKYHADSIYIRAEKKTNKPQTIPIDRINNFINIHKNHTFDNLNILSVMNCPNTGFTFKLNENKTKAMVPEAGIYYPIINNIPILIKAEAKTL